MMRQEITREWKLRVVAASIVVVLVSVGVVLGADPAAASTFTVNSTSDAADANAGNGVCATVQGDCTLRAAMSEATLHRGPDTISFNMPGTGVKTITLGSTLPELKDTSGPTTIDGYTQPGSAPNTDPRASNAAIMVQITSPGTYTSNIYGITVTSPGNTIRGLSFFKLRKPINLTGARTTNNTIAGNFIGTNAAGTYGATSFLSDGNGITVQSGAQNNIIGGTSLADRNVLSGNGRHGISCYFDDTDHNRIINNIMGLSPGGDRRVPNLKHGVDINNGCSDMQVGGTQPGERNVISGNTEEGVEISHLAITTQNKVIGNFIGTDLTGEAAPAYTQNGRRGVHLEDRSVDSTIAYNVIGNSGLQAIRGGPTVNGTVIEHNWIGITPGGNRIPNANVGVKIEGDSSGWRIGPDNVIAYNGSVGVRIDDANSDRNTVTRNSIFGNTGLGIDIQPLGQPNPNDEGDLDTGPNEQLNFPVLKTVTPLRATGTACTDCTVEVFLADDGAGAYGEGKTFVGSSVANADGSFTVELSGAAGGDYVTTTATDAAGNTSEFSPNKVVSNDISAPQAPTGLTATASEGSVTLDWDDDTEPDLAGYSVYRATTSGGPYAKITTSLLSASSYTDTQVVADTTYYYVVTATDLVINESGYGSEASASTLSDTTPPETTLDSGPTGTVTSNSATFTFSSSEADSRFECSLDGATFAACTSAQSYTNLADGSHTFEVRAMDAAGNADPTPEKRTWTVDATAPSVQPPEESMSAGSTLNTSTIPVKLTWSATDGGSGVVKYELQQSTNGGVYASVSLPSATATTRTVTLAPDNATYRFRVRAQDGAGNLSQWSEGPEFVVNAHQETDTGISYSGSWTQEALDSAYGGVVRYARANKGDNAQLSFVGRSVAWVAPKDADRGRADVWIDGVRVQTLDQYASTANPRKVIFSKSWTTSDRHTIEVRALNTKNTSSSGTRVDVDAFVVLGPDGIPPETTLDSGPTGTVTSNSATFTFSSSEADSRFECSLDGATFAACTSAQSYTNLADGSHTFEVRAMDAAGNADPTPEKRTWTVDATAPGAPVIETPQDNSYNNTGIISVSGTTEAGSRIEIFDGSASQGTTTADPNGAWSKELGGVTEGSHTYTATATDAAGNTSAASNVRTVIVDTTAPTVTGVTPEDGTPGIAVTADVEATFSEAMDPSTVSDATFTLVRQNADGTATPVMAAVRYDAKTNRAIFDPVGDLDSGASYLATVESGAGGATDVASNALEVDKTWSFTTA